MSNTDGSFGPFIDPNQPSLRDVLAKLELDPEVTPARLTRVRSAARTMSNALDLPLERIPAHPSWLNGRFRLLKEAGLAAKTVSNVKTELRFAVRTALGRQSRSPMPALSSEFRALYQAVKGSPLEWQLSRFLRYLSGLRVAPENVDDSHAEAYRRDLEADDDVDRAYYRWRAAVRAWNRAVATVPGWPTRVLRLPAQRRPRWTLREEEFTSPFRDDVEACLARMGRSDPLARRGPKRALRPATLRHRRQQYFKFASAAVFSGMPIASLTSFAQLVEPQAFTTTAQYLLDRQEGRLTEALHGLVGGMLAVARHHVGVGEEQYDRLREIHAALDPDEEGFRETTRRRLEQFDDDRNIARLLHLPAYLLRLAHAPKAPCRQRVLLAQMAVAIEILSVAPLRVGNLAGLNLNEHFRRVVADGEEQLILTVPRSDVKNRQDTTYRIAGDSLTTIDAALALYEQRQGHLFPGRCGAKRRSSLSEQIKKAIRRYARFDVNAHLFRALAGLHHLRRHPGAFEDIRVMLHDRDSQTVRDHYTSYSDRHVIRHVQESVLQARRAARDPYPKGPRPRGRPRRWRDRAPLNGRLAP